MGQLVMGYWDCPICGNKEIRGDVAKCPSCGRARGDVEFYVKNYTEGEVLTDSQKQELEFVDEEKAKDIGRNPDWYCSFCNSLNSDNVQVCGTCGASREDSEANYFQMLEKNKAKEAAELAAQPHPAGPKKKRPLWLWIAIIAVVGLLGYLLLWPKPIKGQVTSVNWERSIEVESYQYVSRSDWKLPDGADLTEQKQEITGYIPVLDHYTYREVTKYKDVLDHYETDTKLENKGNGTFETVTYQRPVYRQESYTETVKEPVYRQEPQYATKYYFMIWDWIPVRTETASGNDQNTYWPETNLSENEKEGTRTEIYRFTATDEKGNPTTYQVKDSAHAESDWKNLPVGTKVKITGGKTVTDMSNNKLAEVKIEK